MATALLIIAIATFVGALGTAVAAGFARGGQARTIRRVSNSVPSPLETAPPGMELRSAKWVGRQGFTLATKFITMKHLRSGNATRAEWTQVIATLVALISFTMIFFSIAWMVAGANPLFALVAVIIPGLWLAGVLRAIWTDWRAAKLRQRGGIGPVGR